MLFVHGIEDDVVPFTATAEAARIVRSCCGGTSSSRSRPTSGGRRGGTTAGARAGARAGAGKAAVVDEMYLPRTGHQDVVMELMLGGRSRDGVTRWMREGVGEEGGGVGDDGGGVCGNRGGDRDGDRRRGRRPSNRAEEPTVTTTTASGACRRKVTQR